MEALASIFARGNDRAAQIAQGRFVRVGDRSPDDGLPAVCSHLRFVVALGTGILREGEVVDHECRIHQY